MPKAIKKKAARRPRTEEQDVKTLLARMNETAQRGGRPLAMGAIALAVLIIAVLAFRFYGGRMEAKAQRLVHEGYRLYYGLEENQPAEAERLEAALDRFRKAYSARKSPLSLMYVADSQYALGRYGDAVATLKELNRRFPDDPTFAPLSYYKMALAAMKAGDSEGALKALDAMAALKYGALKDMALMEAGRILEKAGRTEEAMGKYKALVEAYPQSPFFEEASRKIGDKAAEGPEKKG
ncbi:MAG: hypothetical protein Kow0025_00210 [Thermodesulfovibrionales bacterium]